MDLSVFLDILHSGMPEASKDHVFKSILDEDTYQQLIQWQLTNNPFLNQPPRNETANPPQNRNETSRPRRLRRHRNAPNQEEVPDQQGYFTRRFLLSSSCKGKVVGAVRNNILAMEKRGIILKVDDLEDSKVGVTVSCKDQEDLTLAVLEIWDIAGIRMKIERPLSKQQADIVLSWSIDKRAAFIIRTGCNLHITVKRAKTSVSLKGISKEEADAALAQILVESKNEEEADEYLEDEEEEEEKNEVQKFKTMNILLIGMEAVGKSLLINSLINYTKFKQFGEAQLGSLDLKADGKHVVYDKEDNFHNISFVGCEGEDDLAEMPMIYSFNGVVKSQPFEIRLIDTEGIRVSGVNESLAHIEAIVEATRKLGEIHAVVLVMKAGEDRLEVNFRTVVKKLLRSFHRDLLRNVLFCFTRSGPNFNHELISPVLKKFTDEMHEKEDMLIQFSKESSFCFENKGFLDLYASKEGIDMDVENSSLYWDKSAEQAKRFFEKVSELPCFDARRIVPNLPENVQIRPISVANLGELLNGAQQMRNVLQEDNVKEVRNTAARKMLESDLEADIITQLLRVGGPDAQQILKKIIKEDDLEMFKQWMEAPLPEDSNKKKASEADVVPTEPIFPDHGLTDIAPGNNVTEHFTPTETPRHEVSHPYGPGGAETLVQQPTQQRENAVDVSAALEAKSVHQTPPALLLTKLADEMAGTTFKQAENTPYAEETPSTSTSRENMPFDRKGKERQPTGNKGKQRNSRKK